MGKVQRTSICILRVMLLLAPGLGVSSLTFGEFLSSSSVKETSKKTEGSGKGKRNMMSLPSGFAGLRSEESEVERTAEQASSPQRLLEIENQDFVETTDASGGTMINLQGKFQSGLMVSEETQDSPIEKSLPPAMP